MGGRGREREGKRKEGKREGERKGHNLRKKTPVIRWLVTGLWLDAEQLCTITFKAYCVRQCL